MENLKKGLEEYLRIKHYVRDEKNVLNEEVDEFLKIYPKATHDVADTYKKIPKFFKPVNKSFFFYKVKLSILKIKLMFKLPKEDDLLQQRLREEARALFLQKKNKELLSNEELDVIFLG